MGAGWVVGVCINLVGSILINLGTNVMKMGHNRLAAMPLVSSRPQPAIYKLREWQLGVTLFSLGNVANFVSFGYAAQSLLAAIGCIQFVSNVVFARWVLKEQVSQLVLVATACIVAGCVLLVSGGSHASAKYTYRELLHLYGRPAYISYLAVGGAAVVATYAGYYWGQRAVIVKDTEAPRLWAAALPILYSIFSALIGTQSVLFSKTLAVLLRSTFTGDNQLDKWFTWFVLVAFLTTAVFWVTRLNKGLRMFPALIIVPALQICWTLFSILSGMLYFHEYEGMHPGSIAMFVIGVTVVFAGVFLLTRASQPSSAARGQPTELMSTHSKVPLACAVRDSDTAPILAGTSAASDDPQWTLRAMRPAHSAPTSAEIADMIRAAAQLHTAERQPAGIIDPDEASEDEQEYERALLACTTGTLAGSSCRQPHPQRQQQQAGQQKLQRQLSLSCVEAVGAAATAAGQGSPDQQGRAATFRERRRWLHRAGSLKRRFALDFSLDETAAAKLSLGLGDPHTPGFSLFTLPMVDIKGLPYETRSWQSASPGDGCLYGRVPETSLAGAQPLTPAHVQPVRGSQIERVDKGRKGPALGDGLVDGGACGHGHSSGLSMTSAAVSFTWPPGGSEPSGTGQAPDGPLLGINPLANALDLRSTRTTSSKAPTRTLSQDSVPPAAAAVSKWNVLQKAIKSNMVDLKGLLQSAASEGPEVGRQYACMAPASLPAGSGRPTRGNTVE